MQPGRTPKKPAPRNLFNTWLDYRLSKEQSKADLIREVSAKVERKYDNDRFYKWSTQQLNVPEPVLLEFIYPELPQVLEYFYNMNGYSTKDIDFNVLAETIVPPNLSIVLKRFYETNGFNSKEIDFDLFAEAFKPAVKDVVK